MTHEILIATFSLRVKNKRSAINGMIEPLLSYFLPKTKTIHLIDGTHPGGSSVKTFYDIYEKGKFSKELVSFSSSILYPLLKIQNTNGTQVFFKIRDLLSTIELLFRLRKRYDFFIGLESIFTLGGIILKKIGFVKKVIYYVSDYTPNRYSNKLFNDLYLLLDRFCCYHSDFIWDVSPAMQPARIKVGLDAKKCASVILVPNALFPKQISYLPVKKIKPYSLVFAGTFGPENGLPIAIKAMKKIISKIPQVRLHILGGGQTPESELKKIAEEQGVEKNIIFHGFISDAIELSKLIKEFAIGLAPYMSFPDSTRWYADATKIRLYFGAGLPVITTHVPPFGKEVRKKNAGLIIKDNEKELANAVVKIFKNKTLYQTLRKNAIDFAKNNTWEKSYFTACEKMQLL